MSVLATPLLEGIGRSELERIEHFATPFRAAAGEVLFSQGEAGDRLYLLGRGEIEVLVETIGEPRRIATLGPGGLLGEMSVLGGTRRTGTAVALADVSGWMLHRASLDMLRLDPGAGAVEFVARLTELALGRLRARYEELSAQLAGAGSRGAEPDPPASSVSGKPAEPLPWEYLHSLLCFSRFHDRGQIDAALGGAVPIELPAGAVAMAPGGAPHELLLVLRGALDVSLRRGRSARRVRLAGPGRFVGHLGALDDGPNPAVAHAREPVVVAKLPAERVRVMLRDPAAHARLFTAGLAEDVARALRQAERPVAQVLSAPLTLDGGRRGP